MFSKCLLSELINGHQKGLGHIIGHPSGETVYGCWKEWAGRRSKCRPPTKTTPSHRSGLGLPLRPPLRCFCSWSSCCSCYTPHLCPRALALAFPASMPTTTPAWLPCSLLSVLCSKVICSESPPWLPSKFLTLSLPLLGPSFTFLHCTCHLKQSAYLFVSMFITCFPWLECSLMLSWPPQQVEPCLTYSSSWTGLWLVRNE